MHHFYVKGAVKDARIAGSASRWGELVNVLYSFVGFRKERKKES
ncbi:hypothetical protein B4080_5486 [Bacillus cereus]|nr:hypothetical protein B4080_5486 [Bacillus cereus]